MATTKQYIRNIAQVKKVGDTLTIVSDGAGVLDEKSVIATGSETPRMLADRFADVINVKDYGAVGDGTSDCTTAFESALSLDGSIFIPTGTYRLDTTGLDMARCYGDGIIWPTNTGIPFRASGASIIDQPAFEECLGYPKTEDTGTGSFDGTPIFSHATTRAQQGGCYYKSSDGIGHYIVAFRTASNSDTTYAGNACRLVEFRFDSDGKLLPDNYQYTDTLAIGHGQGLGVTIESGDVYIWSQAYNTAYATQGLRISKTHWRGASTTSDDITYYQLLDDVTTASINVVSVSSDGKYLVNVGPASEGFKVTGWKIKDISNLAPKAFEFMVASTSVFSFLQGICADSHYIYLLAGSAAMTLPRGVLVSDYSGNIIKTIYCSTDTHSYGGFDGIISRTSDLVWACELEHITIREGDLLIGGVVGIRDYGDIVSDGDYKYAARTASGTDEETGTSFVSGEYLDSDYWQPTELEATAGEFEGSKQYTVGTEKIKRKFLYRLGASNGSSSEHEAIKDFTNGHNEAINAYKNCYFYTREQNGFYFYNVRAVDGSVKRLLSLNHRGNMYHFDGDAGANTSKSSLTYTYSKNDNNWIQYCGGSSRSAGGSVVLTGNADNDANVFALSARVNNTENFGLTKTGITVFKTSPSIGGSLSTAGIYFVRQAEPSTVFSETSTYNAGKILSTTNYFNEHSYNRYLSLGAEATNGTRFGLNISNGEQTAGGITLEKAAMPSADNAGALGLSNYRWTQVYAATETISTSDERFKSNIVSIPDAVLDTWGDVGWCQFQFADSVEKKGDDARLHSGVIAQRIDAVFKSHGLDATRYGLLCHDAWDAQDAVYDENGNIEEPAREAGDIWSVRYTEALAMEAAYQRRRADRIEARLTALERKLDDGSSSAEEVANADYSD